MTFEGSEQPHSAAYFNPHRDFWWNLDYLQLLAGRLGLGDVRSVLDVGAGVGHWGAVLLPLLTADATIVGVERDPRWVDRARERATEFGVADRCRYVQGVAESLEFADDAFDLVTCQTLLIHVADVPAVLSEMCRVLRPGGLLLVAEPNNLAGMLVADSTTAGQPIVERVERVAFALLCERGKAALGEGDNSVGDLLPGYFAQAGLLDIQTFLNDKTFALVPPYALPEQQALKTAMLEDVGSDRWGGRSASEVKRYYLAGGGAEDEFEARWQRRLSEDREAACQLTANQLHTAGGGLQYVVSGRRTGSWWNLNRAGVRLACRDFGGEGPPVLLLHGLAGHAEEWAETARWLTARHRVLALEARGHGRSERVPLDVSREAHVADTSLVIERLGLGPVVLVGQSLGGHTAFLVAARRQDLVRALVIADASPAGSGEDIEPAVSALGESLRRWPVPFASRAAALDFFGGPSLTAETWTEGLERRNGGWWPCFEVEVMIRTLREAVSQPYWTEWDRISCPTLVVRAGQGVVDPADAREMTDRLPQAQLVELPDAAHDLHLDRPNEWREAVNGFLDSLDIEPS